MIEPTETESRETIDEFIAAMLEIAAQVESDPESLKKAPLKMPIKRLDEVRAARQPQLADL
jgi:glycine dehydrogenase subunit 2